MNIENIFEAKLKDSQKKRKSKKLNTAVTIESKDRMYDFDEFRLLYGYSKAKTLEWCAELGKQIKQWALQKRTEDDPLCSYTIEEFYILRGIPYTTWLEWLKASEDLRNDVQDATYILGITREMRALREKDNAAVLMRVQSYYSPVWEKVEARQAELKKQDPNSGGTITIYAETIPQSNQVSEKLKIKNAS